MNRAGSLNKDFWSTDMDPSSAYLSPDTDRASACWNFVLQIVPEVWLVLSFGWRQLVSWSRVGLSSSSPKLVPVTGRWDHWKVRGLVACSSIYPCSIRSARARVDKGAPGRVQRPQSMLRLSSSTTQPAKCCSRAWKAPPFSHTPQRNILRLVCGTD